MRLIVGRLKAGLTHRVAGSLVASTHDVKLLVRARMQKQPLPEESLLTQGWRAEHVLPVLLAVLDGRRAVRIGKLNSEAPFAFDDVS